MNGFITADLSSLGHTIAYVDGSKCNNKTKIENRLETQLRRAKTEECGFQWNGRNIKEVIISNMIIYDRVDMACLQWFINAAIKIDLSKSYVSSEILNELNEICQMSIDVNWKVPEGSSIRIPKLTGYSGMAITDKTENLCERIGFKVFLGGL